VVDGCLLHSYQLHVSALMAHLQVDELTKKHISSYISHASFIRRMGGGLLEGGTRSRMYWVGRGMYNHMICSVSNLTRSRPVGAALIHADRQTDMNLVAAVHMKTIYFETTNYRRLIPNRREEIIKKVIIIIMPCV
jgi:hypothetical protein